MAALLALAGCAPAMAQDLYCGPTWRMRADLRADPWREAPLIALIPDGAPDGTEIELWLNMETESWTLLVNSGDGISCVLFVGDGLAPFLMRRAG